MEDFTQYGKYFSGCKISLRVENFTPYENIALREKIFLYVQNISLDEIKFLQIKNVPVRRSSEKPCPHPYTRHTNKDMYQGMYRQLDTQALVISP